VQGWKLHVSSTVADAEQVLRAVVLVLAGARCAFKFAGMLELLARMNDAHAPRANSGKFLTVYPAADADVPELARLLDSATTGLAGPAILSDTRYLPESLVHLRFGAFTGVPVLSADGEISVGLLDPDGRVVADRREPRFTPPLRLLARHGRTPRPPAGPRWQKLGARTGRAAPRADLAG